MTSQPVESIAKHGGMTITTPADAPLVIGLSVPYEDEPDGRVIAHIPHAYTVIARSSTDSAQARATATDLRAHGFDVGVLRSDNYSHLRSGYWVAFSGVYDTIAAARSHMVQLS